MIQWPQLGGYSLFAPFSNFTGSGPVEVGSLAGLTSFGAFDMAGNVREWCWNQTSAGRLVRGGSWGDSTYRFTELSQSPPFERSPKHGFRTVLIENPGTHASAAFAPLEFGHPVDYYAQPPIADEIYEVYKEQFDYDHTALNIRLEMETDSESWVRETVTFDAAYADERVMAHLFLPKNASPPFQSVIYFPGSAALYTPSSENFDAYYEVPVFLSFLIKNGRAVLFQ